MSEDRTWARDPIFLERQRVTLAALRERAEAVGVWLHDARQRIESLERRLARTRTAELGHYEPNDEPPS